MNGAKRNHGIMDGASCDRSLLSKMSCFEFCCVCGFQCHISSERKEDGWLTDHLLNSETLIFVSGLSPCSRPIWLTATARRRKHPKGLLCVRACVCCAQQVFWQSNSPPASPHLPWTSPPSSLLHPIMWNGPVCSTTVTYLCARLMFLYWAAPLVSDKIQLP